MRILQFTGVAGPGPIGGGVWRVASTQSEELRALGHEVTLLSGWWGRPPSDGTTDELYVRLRRTLPLGRVRFLFAPKLPAILRKSSPDVAHVHLCRDFLSTLTVLLLARRGVPVVAQMHGMVSPPRTIANRLFDRLVLGRVLRKVDMFLSLGDFESELIGAMGIDAGRIAPIDNAVPIPGPAWDASKLSDESAFVFLSRLHPRKQPRVFVEAALSLVAGGSMATFVLAGPDEGEAAAVDRLIRASDARMRFAPVRQLDHDDALELLATARAMVLPSIEEPYPMVVLEAAAMGTPIILTASSGIASLVAEWEAGLVVEPSVSAVADAMRTLETHPESCRDLGRRARELHRHKWQPRTLATVLVERYSGVIAAGPAMTLEPRPVPRRDRAWAGVTTCTVVWSVGTPDLAQTIERLAQLIESLPNESWVKTEYETLVRKCGLNLRELLAGPTSVSVVDLKACDRDEFMTEVSRLARGADDLVLRVIRAEAGIAILNDHSVGDAAIVLPVVLRLLGVPAGGDEPPPLGCPSVATGAVAHVGIGLMLASRTPPWRVLLTLLTRATSRVTRRLRPRAVAKPSPSRLEFIPVRISAEAMRALDCWRRREEPGASSSVYLFFVFLSAFRSAGLIVDPVDAHVLVSLRRFSDEMRRSGGNVIGSINWTVGALAASEVSGRLRTAIRSGELVLNFLLGRIAAMTEPVRDRKLASFGADRWAVSWSDLGRLDSALRGYDVWRAGEPEDERVAGFTIPVPGRLLAFSVNTIAGAANIICTFDGAVLDRDAVAKVVRLVAENPLDFVPTHVGQSRLEP